MSNDQISLSKTTASQVRYLIKIILLLVDERPLGTETSLTSALDTVKNKLILMALNEAGGNTTAAAEILLMNRTTLMEHFRRRGGPDSRLFPRRRNRLAKQH